MNREEYILGDNSMKKENKNRANLTCHCMYVGIDVGFTGGLTILNEDVCESYEFPIIIEKDSKGKDRKRLDVNQLIFITEQLIPANSVIALEMQTARPKQGVVSVFSLARQFGILEGLMTYMSGSPPHFIPPKKWKAFYPELITDEIRDLRVEKKSCKNKKRNNQLTYQIKKKIKEQSIIVANQILKDHYRFNNDKTLGPDPEYFLKGEDGLSESFLIAFFALKTL